MKVLLILREAAERIVLDHRLRQVDTARVGDEYSIQRPPVGDGCQAAAAGATGSGASGHGLARVSGVPAALPVVAFQAMSCCFVALRRFTGLSIFCIR